MFPSNLNEVRVSLKEVPDHSTAIFPNRSRPGLTGIEINVAFLVNLQILTSQTARWYTNMEHQNNVISTESREEFLYALTELIQDEAYKLTAYAVGSHSQIGRVTVGVFQPTHR